MNLRDKLHTLNMVRISWGLRPLRTGELSNGQLRAEVRRVQSIEGNPWNTKD